MAFAARQGVLQKGIDELDGGKSGGLLLAAIPLVVVPEEDLVVFDAHQAIIGDGHAAHVACQAGHDLRSRDRYTAYCRGWPR